MFKSVTIKTKLLTIILSTIIIITILFLTNVIQTINDISSEKISKYEKEAYTTKEQELSNYLSIALSTVEAFYQRGSKEKIELEVKDELKKHSSQVFSMINKVYEKFKNKLTQEELKAKLKFIINSNRYGKSGYFWINNMQPKMVMHPIQPNLDGKDLSTYKDPNGAYLFNEMVKVCKNSDEGFVNYNWIKPGFSKPQPKISFVKLFKPYNWIIGTGAYVDDITLKLQKEALIAISKMRYGKNGYFWINDMQPKMIMHPMQPNLDGKDLSTYKDPNGVYLFNEMVKVCKNSVLGGLVKYSWAKPNKKKPQPKFSYVKKFKGWDWILGTGAYVDDIVAKVDIMKKETKEKINSTVVSFILKSIIIMIIIIFIVNLVVNNTVVKPLKDFQSGFMSFFRYLKKDSIKVKLLDIYSNDEIGKMASIVNKNIKYIKKVLDHERSLENELKELNETLEQKIKTEVEKNLKQERVLAESAKMAQMGEMIGNIAHQWRQPLSIISTVSTGVIAQQEIGILDDKTLIKNMEKINDSSQYLSETINTFRDFLKEEKVLKEQTLQANIKSALSIVGTVLKDVNIEIIQEIDYENLITITMVSGELPQVIINIINNAKDILLERKIKDGWVKLSLSTKNSKAIITIEDNAGGIPKDVLPKIFNPYFTTKHQSVGTGLGLHMSKRIVQESLQGDLYAKNSKNGGMFIIEIPL